MPEDHNWGQWIPARLGPDGGWTTPSKGEDSRQKRHGRESCRPWVSEMCPEKWTVGKSIPSKLPTPCGPWSLRGTQGTRAEHEDSCTKPINHSISNKERQGMLFSQNRQESKKRQVNSENQQKHEWGVKCCFPEHVGNGSWQQCSKTWRCVAVDGDRDSHQLLCLDKGFAFRVCDSNSHKG